VITAALAACARALQAAARKLRLGYGTSNATLEGEAVVLNFTNVLWLAIAVLEALLVTARIFMHPGPVRVTFALMIPFLIILGAIINAIYNRITTGHAIDDLPAAKRH
jgi:hypothetical protein